MTANASRRRAGSDDHTAGRTTPKTRTTTMITAAVIGIRVHRLAITPTTDVMPSALCQRARIIHHDLP